MWRYITAGIVALCIVTAGIVSAVVADINGEAAKVHERPPVMDASEPRFDPPKEKAEGQKAKTKAEQTEAVAEQGNAESVISGYVENFARDGVIYGDDGTMYTYYSQNVLPGLAIEGKTVGDDGIIRDGMGRVVCASCDHPHGAEVLTPFGMGVVLDFCETSGVIDIYTDF